MFYQISLLAAFIAGMVALFAPCCVSYLFPAYLGNIFKEKRRVLLMTLIYSLGIFVVMLPVVLGAKALSSLFFKLHDQTYLFGGLFMLLVSFLSLLGLKLPLPHLTYQPKSAGSPDIASSFTLGLFSGITSACCAPVLLGVITLSTLTPTTFLALLLGVMYVLGMVTPLYLAALVVDKYNLLQKPFLKKQLTQIHWGKKTYPVFIANLIAFIVFFSAALLMIVLTLQGKLGMSVAEAGITKTINQVAFRLTLITQNPWLNTIFGLLVLYWIYKLVKNSRR